MLPREDLLAGAQDPDGLKGLIDLAEEVLRTWQPAWSPFLSAPLREEALARLGSLSELAWLSDGGYPGAERQRLLCHRRDDLPDATAPIHGLLIEGNFLFDPLSPDDLREALQGMGIDDANIGDLWVRGDRGGQGLCTPSAADALHGRLGAVRDVEIRCEARPLEQLQPPRATGHPHLADGGGLLSPGCHRIGGIRTLPGQDRDPRQSRTAAAQLGGRAPSEP